MTNTDKQTRPAPSQEELMGDVYYRLAKKYLKGLLKRGLITAHEFELLEKENLGVYRPFLYQLME